jgi:hypothetical protein
VVETIAEVIFAFVANVGQATKDEIRTHCKAQGIPTDLYQKGLAKLQNQDKFLTDVVRDDGSKAVEIKRSFRSGDYRAALTLQQEVAKPPPEKYRDWYEITGTLTLRTPALSPCPVVGNPSARAFIHDGAGNIVLVDKYFQRMFHEATLKPDVPAVGNAKFAVQFEPQYLPESVVVTTLRPVPPARKGGSGQGITEVESLPAGAKIPFAAMVPGSHITRDNFIYILDKAARWVGFSPSGAHQGWGRFQLSVDGPIATVAA